MVTQQMISAISMAWVIPFGTSSQRYMGQNGMFYTLTVKLTLLGLKYCPNLLQEFWHQTVTTRRIFLNLLRSPSTRPLLFLLCLPSPKRKSTPFRNTSIQRKTQSKTTTSCPKQTLGNLTPKCCGNHSSLKDK